MLDSHHCLQAILSLNWSHRDDVIKNETHWVNIAPLKGTLRKNLVQYHLVTEDMDYSISNGLLYPLRIVLLPVKWNNLHFAPNPITESKSVPDLRTEKEFKRSRPEVKRSLSEGHVSTVNLEEILLSLKEWKQNKVCRRVTVWQRLRLSLVIRIVLIVKARLQ